MLQSESVIDIQKTLKARQLLEQFDMNLTRLKGNGFHEDEVDTLEMLSSCLEEAIENGMETTVLQSRVSRLARYALERGYQQHEVENLLTMHPIQTEND